MNRNVTRCGAHSVAGHWPGTTRVLRGGSFNNNSRNARCSFRNRNNPDNRNRNNGFRVVVSTFFEYPGKPRGDSRFRIACCLRMPALQCAWRKPGSLTRQKNGGVHPWLFPHLQPLSPWERARVREEANSNRPAPSEAISLARGNLPLRP